MRITEHANLRIGDWEPVGREEKRILLEAAGRRRAKRVDILRDYSSRDSGNRALNPASAVDEGGANDDSRSDCARGYYRMISFTSSLAL